MLWPDPLYAALAEDGTHVLMLNTAPEAGYTVMNEVFGERSAPAYFAVVFGE